MHGPPFARTQGRTGTRTRGAGALENRLAGHGTARSRASGNRTAGNGTSLGLSAGRGTLRSRRWRGRLVHGARPRLRHNHAARRSGGRSWTLRLNGRRCRRGLRLYGRLRGRRNRRYRGRRGLRGRNWGNRTNRRRRRHWLRRLRGRWLHGRSARRNGCWRRHHRLRRSGRGLNRSWRRGRGLAFHRGRRGGRGRRRSLHRRRTGGLLLLRDQLQHISRFGDMREVNFSLNGVGFFGTGAPGPGRPRPLRLGLGLKMGPNPHRFIRLN
jgi:hypothetical protein